MRDDDDNESSEDAGTGVSGNDDSQTSEDEDIGTQTMPNALLQRCKQIGHVNNTSTPLVSERFIRAWELLGADRKQTSDKELYSARTFLLSYASSLYCFKISSAKSYVSLRWAVYLEWLIITDAEQEAWLKVLEFDPGALRELFFTELKSLCEICGVWSSEFHSNDQILEAYVEANARVCPLILNMVEVESGTWKLSWVSGQIKEIECHDSRDLPIEITIAAESNRWKITGDGDQVCCFPRVHNKNPRQLKPSRIDIPRLGEATATEIMDFAVWLDADAERVRSVAMGLDRVRSNNQAKNREIPVQAWPDTDDENDWR